VPRRQKLELNRELFDLSLIIRILRVVWSCSARLTVARLVVLLFQALLPLVPLYLMKLLLDAFVDDVKPTFNYILWILIGFATVKILSIVIANVSNYINLLHSDIIADHMSNMVISKAIQTDLQYFDSDIYHDIFARAIGQSSNRPLAVLQVVLTLIQNLISLIAIIGLLFTLHWGIALILFVVALPAAVIRWRFTEKTVKLREEQTQRERRSGYLRRVLTGASYAKEVRIFDFGKQLLGQFLNLRSNLRKEKRDLYLRQNVTIGIAQSVESVAIIAALGFLATRALQGLLSVGDIAMYYGVFQKGQSNINGILKTFVSIHQNRLFLGHLFQFLDLEPKILDAPEAVHLPEQISSLQLKDIHFTYPDTEREVISNLNLDLKRGDIVAIVGENGSGKSTLVKLLSRLYQPTRGDILINHKPIEQFTLSSYRKRLTVIYQLFAKYNASVTENIQYADMSQALNQHDIQEAAKLAHSDGFIGELPSGYDTQLGRSFRQGEELSGGQWQKLALSRAFYKNADLIILDEPTSFIDPLAEEDIFASLREIAQDKILILITHRIYNLKMADQILVMDQGRIVEQGDHSQLIEEQGLYHEMFSKQS